MKNRSILFAWATIMEMRISAQAVARTILRGFEQVEPLSPEEARRVQFALENSGVQDATTRFVAAFSKVILKQVTTE